jgi:hypothetical protein
VAQPDRCKEGPFVNRQGLSAEESGEGLGAAACRFADDLVIIFEHERDARRVFDVLPKRMAKYGLTLHPEKTRLIDFRRPGLRVSASPDNNGDACSRPAPSTCWGSPITGPSPARDTGW